MSETETVPTEAPVAPPPSDFHKHLARALVTAMGMPPVEKFVELNATLKGECEKAGELTEERGKLFDEWEKMMHDSKHEFDDSIVEMICKNLTERDILTLIQFHTSPLSGLVEKTLGLRVDAHNIGIDWRTKTLERCHDTWMMIVECVGQWQDKNTPAGSHVDLPTLPGDGGWKEVPVTAGEMPANDEETWTHVDTSAEEAELKKMAAESTVESSAEAPVEPSAEGAV